MFVGITVVKRTMFFFHQRYGSLSVIDLNIVTPGGCIQSRSSLCTTMLNSTWRKQGDGEFHKVVNCEVFCSVFLIVHVERNSNSSWISHYLGEIIYNLK